MLYLICAWDCMLFPESKVPVAYIAGEHWQQNSRKVRERLGPPTSHWTFGENIIWQQLRQIHTQPPRLQQGKQINKEKPEHFVGSGIRASGEDITLIEYIARCEAGDKGKYYSRAEAHKNTVDKATTKIAGRGQSTGQ
jgi:hypothetical protein